MSLIMRNRHLFSIVVVVAQNSYSVIERLLSCSYIQPFSLYFCFASVTWFLLRQTQVHRQVYLLFFQQASATIFLPHQLGNEQTHWYRTTVSSPVWGRLAVAKRNWLQRCWSIKGMFSNHHSINFCTFKTIFNWIMSPWVVDWNFYF